ncbi:hypothetical protein CEXT_515351, partial [Caerostris extrusa]
MKPLVAVFDATAKIPSVEAVPTLGPRPKNLSLAKKAKPTTMDR